MFGAGKEAQESFVAALIDKHLPNLERQLGDKDFFVGDMLTVAGAPTPPAPPPCPPITPMPAPRLALPPVCAWRCSRPVRIHHLLSII